MKYKHFKQALLFKVGSVIYIKTECYEKINFVVVLHPHHVC